MRAQAESSWTLLPPAPIEGRAYHSAVWTGEEMIVWGGASRGRLFGDGAAYDPITNRWRLLAPSPLAARTGHTVVWTGHEMILWGGCCERRGAELGTGAAYDPKSDTWRRLPPAPIENRRGHTAVWTGRHMLIWGGTVFEHAFADGAMYSPRRDRWSRLPDAPIEPRYSHSAVWSGSEMIVWGGATLEPEILDDGAAFGAGWSPVSRSLPGRSEHTAVWTGSEMLVWGGCCDDKGRQLPGGSAYEPTSDTWRALPDSGLVPRVGFVALPANGRMLVWGGLQGFERRLADGAVYEPLRDVWVPLPPAPLEGRHGAAGVWTGETFLVWGGCCDAGRRAFADGAGLDLALEQASAAASPEAIPIEGHGSCSVCGLFWALGVAFGLPVLGLIIWAIRKRRSERDG